MFLYDFFFKNDLRFSYNVYYKSFYSINKETFVYFIIEMLIALSVDNITNFMIFMVENSSIQLSSFFYLYGNSHPIQKS